MLGVLVSSGHVLEHTPSTDLPVGSVVIQGGLVGVTVRPLAANETGVLLLEGVFRLPKATGVQFAVGDLVGWDTTDRRAVAPGEAIPVIGKAVKAAASADTEVQVRLSN